MELLAAISWEQFTIHTAKDETKSINGAEWYYNGGALGFAGSGLPIFKQIVTFTMPEKGGCVGIHRSKAMHLITIRFLFYLDNGFRAGSNLDLNFGNTGWDRVVFTAGITSVPVGSPAALF